MRPLKFDAPVTGDALLLGARLPRKEELPVNPTPKRISAAVMQDETGKMFTAIDRRDLCATTSDLNNDEIMVAAMAPCGFKGSDWFESQYLGTPVLVDMIQDNRVFDFKCQGTRSGRAPNAFVAFVADDFVKLEALIASAEAERLMRGEAIPGVNFEVRGDTIYASLPPSTFSPEEQSP